MAAGLKLGALAFLLLGSTAAMAQAKPTPDPLQFQLGPLGKSLKSRGSTCPPLSQGQPVAQGDWTDSMQFTVRQGVKGPVLVAAGGVAAGDAQRLKAAIERTPGVSEVWLDSPGGDAAEGPKLGRVIRSARLGTRVGSGYMCASSCTFAFLGGVVRRVEPGASYAVHTFFASKAPDHYVRDLTNSKVPMEERMRVFRERIHEQERDDAMLAGDLQLYAQQMGIARAFMTSVVFSQKSLVFLTDAEIRQLQASGMADSEIASMLQTIRCMGADEMRKYNVVNVAG